MLGCGGDVRMWSGCGGDVRMWSNSHDVTPHFLSIPLIHDVNERKRS